MQDHAGSNSQARTAHIEHAVSERHADPSPAAAFQEQLAANMDPRAQSGKARWSHRLSLLLILSVGIIFWGGVWWLFFG